MAHPDVRTPAGLAEVRAAEPAKPPATVIPVDQEIAGPAGSLRLRTCTPPGVRRGTLLRIHGGGFAVGSPEHDDVLNVRLARSCAVTVVSPAYRRAPEVTLHEAIADVAAALRWVLDAGGPVLLAGTSAGSHLALSAALRVRDVGDLAGLAGMHLDCGRYDLAGTPSARRADAATLLLTREWLDGFRELALPGVRGAALRDPQVSPLHADLRGLPPTLLTVGGLDPLLDDSRLLADRLREAGGTADLDGWPRAPHSFLASGSPLAELALARVAAWLDARLRDFPGNRSAPGRSADDRS